METATAFRGPRAQLGPHALPGSTSPHSARLLPSSRGGVGLLGSGLGLLFLFTSSISSFPRGPCRLPLPASRTSRGAKATTQGRGSKPWPPALRVPWPLLVHARSVPGLVHPSTGLLAVPQLRVPQPELGYVRGREGRALAPARLPSACVTLLFSARGCVGENCPIQNTLEPPGGAVPTLGS